MFKSIVTLIIMVVWSGQICKVSGNCPKLENTVVNDLLSTILKIRGSASNRELVRRDYPAFTAYRASEQSLSSSQIVSFDKTWINNKSAYNPKTGIFTAPMKGLYHFSVVGMSVHNKSLYLQLYQNNTKIASSFISESGGYRTGTIDVVLQLVKGDKVFVKSASSQSIFSSTQNYSTFSGYLVSQ